MTGRLAEKVVLITGAGGGQGAREAVDFAAQGARVWALDIDEAGLAEVRAQDPSITTRQLDVVDEDAWQHLVADVIAAHGRIDGLVNNAGIVLRGDMSTPVGDVRRNLEVNTIGPYLGMQAVAPAMKAQRSGSIVNIGSIAAMDGYPTPAYGISKWAIRGLSKIASLEYAAWGIRVNAIHPNIIDTPLIQSRALIETMADFTPMGRVGTVEEISHLVLFLLSGESEYITGADIPIDGGFTAGNGVRMVHKILGTLPTPEAIAR
jgi:3alpha(or 20beta)-hydroxysteroid dehydrogenase